MNEDRVDILVPMDEVKDNPLPEPAQAVEVVPVKGQPEDWHAEAGRKGARRVHELIQRGRLYEQEHGLKSGRQRLRQLAELGKVYEQEHGLRPVGKKKRAGRLSRGEREELLSTLLQCLLRIAKPSLRAGLTQLIAALDEDKKNEAA